MKVPPFHQINETTSATAAYNVETDYKQQNKPALYTEI